MGIKNFEFLKKPIMAPAFVPGDKVLAYHGPLLYVAKIMDVDLESEQPRYFIHYEGWKRKWDEWVASDRLLPDTPDNQQKLKQLINEQKQKKAQAGGAAKKMKTTLATSETTTPLAATSNEGDNEGDDDAGIEEENPFEEAAIKIQLPEELKKLIVEDWENVTQRAMLVSLPRTPSVNDLFKAFMNDGKRKNTVQQAMAQIVEGLSVYFDRALPLILLYKSERAQLASAVEPGKRFSDVYGLEHLLRLFVRLPHLLAHADISEADLILLQARLQDLFKFLIRPEVLSSGGAGKMYVLASSLVKSEEEPAAAAAAAAAGGGGGDAKEQAVVEEEEQTL
jgi:mortality factor 4-like protein 1